MIERLLLAEGALERGELDAAERQFALVADADPRNAMAVVGLARVAVRRGDRHAARALAMRALGIDPDEAAAARLLAELDREPAAAIPEPPGPPTPAPVASPTPPPAAVSAPAPVAARPWWRRWLDRLRGRG